MPSQSSLQGLFSDAMTHFRTGRQAAARKLCKQLLVQQPEQPNALHLLGLIESQAGRPERAAAFFERAIKVIPDFPQAHVSLGNIWYSLHRLEEAESAYRKAVEARPEFSSAWASLANALRDQDRLDEALEACRTACEQSPGTGELRVNLGSLYKDMGRHEEAIAAYREAIAIKPDLAAAHYSLGVAYQETDAYDDAIACYRHAAEIQPDYVRPHQSLADLLLSRGDHAAALEACDACLALDPGNRYALAIMAAAKLELGDDEAVRKLVDFDRLIAPVRIPVPEGYADMAAFNAALEAHSLAHPTLLREPHNKATRFGRQTRNLLIGEKGPVAHLEQAINRAMEDYLRDHPADPDHPFLACPPKNWWLNVWATVLGKQGHQTQHVHPAGWLSGVFYVRLPEVMSAGGDKQGWIEFGRPDARYNCTVEPEVRLIRPEEGLMVLFPSYIYHGTIPFESDDTRISIAFDMMPID